MGAKRGRKVERLDAMVMDAAGDGRAPGETEGGSSWLDSTDPRRRRIGRGVLAAVWIYVAALWVLALDQTFGWGVF
jgi:hypothetical protein